MYDGGAQAERKRTAPDERLDSLTLVQGALEVPSERSEIVSSTGVRLVGKAVGLVSEGAIAGLRVPDRPGDFVFGTLFRVPAQSTSDRVPAVLSVLHAALLRTWSDAEPLRRDAPASRTAGRAHAFSWESTGQKGQWTGEFLWRHPHPSVGGASCITHVVLAEHPGVLQVGVRVAVEGGLAAVRGTVGAAQSRPAWLTDLARAVQLSFEGRPPQPIPLADDEVAAFVTNVLLSETREYPVAVLAPTEAGEYLVPPEDLAAELLGIAPLFVLARHQTTFRLTDELGDRRLSAYWGALRVYLPGFSCADWSDAHPLLRNDVIGDAVVRSEVIGKLAVRSAQALTMPAGVHAVRSREEAARAAAERPPDATATASTDASAANTANAANAESAADAAVVRALSGAVTTRLDEVTVQLSHLVGLTRLMSDELTRLRTTSSVRAAGTASLERRIERLDELLRRHLVPATDPAADTTAERAARDADAGVEETRRRLVDAVRQAAVQYADALLILDNAERSAADSPYEDVDRAEAALEAMSYVAQRRRVGTLGVSLRDAFREHGIDYRGFVAASTPKRMTQQYAVVAPDGTTYYCEEHLVLGHSYDPRHCLRIYFTSRAANETRFVIGHIGRHLDVLSTT